jgi:FAD binding domain
LFQLIVAMAGLPVPGALPIPGFSGASFDPSSPGYHDANDLYATSTYGKERNMNPGEILQPTNVDDIIAVVKAANQRRQKLAIRTGGHQYSGASSTTPANLQLDLKPTFRDPNKDIQLIRKDGKVYIRTSVSWTLRELFDFTTKNGVFLPTGQCVTVCLGGHAQTGGYGMFGRSLGLLGDYVQSLETVSPQGEREIITKADTEKYYGFLGGSPGNMGVVHHLTVEVQEDVKHPHSKGDRVFLWYSKQNYKAALEILAEKAADDNWPRNYDMTVNVYSEGIELGKLFSGAKRDKLQSHIPDRQIQDEELLTLKIPVIIIYLQWINFGNDTYDPTLLQRIQSIGWNITLNSGPDEPVSKIASFWLFDKDREFPYPYVKRCNGTNSKTLVKDGWPAFMSEQMDKIAPATVPGVLVSSQIQVYGGKFSQFAQHAGNGTAYSWRDTTIGGTWDVFYMDGHKAQAEAWQAQTDSGLFGSKGVFCKDERRVLWGSYGDWDLSKQKAHYYEAGAFERIQKIRTTVDPKGTFEPNPFCVPSVLK